MQSRNFYLKTMFFCWQCGGRNITSKTSKVGGGSTCWCWSLHAIPLNINTSIGTEIVFYWGVKPQHKRWCDVAATKTSSASFLCSWALSASPKNRSTGSCSASTWQTPPTSSSSHRTSATGVQTFSVGRESCVCDHDAWAWACAAVCLWRSAVPLHVLRWISRGDLQVHREPG